MTTNTFGYKFSNTKDNNIFDRVNVNEYVEYFPRKQFDINSSYNSRIGIKRKKLNSDYDKLFFNFLVIINHKFEYNYNKKYEKNIKLRFVEQIQDSNMKFKNIDNIIENISYDENISVESLDLLAKFVNINIIMYDDVCFYEKIYNEDSQAIFCVHLSSNIYEKDRSCIESLKNSRYEISVLSKPLYSMSRYKLDELKEIYDSMMLTNNDNKMKKKDYYDRISCQISNSLFYTQ